MLLRLIARALRKPPSSANEAESAVVAPELDGPDYRSVLERMHVEMRPRRYLEIGTSWGATLRLAQPETVAIGVDPAPRIDGALAPNMRVFPETSDQFFSVRDVRAELGGPPDMVFIDGMHLFEFALRDFMNAERVSSRDSVILLHDVYPPDEASAARERGSVVWSGDVWRTVLALKKYRPDLRIETFAAPPTGLCMVRRLDPESTVLARRIDEIVAEFMSVDYGFLGDRKAQLLNLIPIPSTADRLLSV